MPTGSTSKSSFPLVSVVLPTHNRAALLKRAIKSVLNQTYRHLELTVVDDGSQDDTPAIPDHFNDARLRYLRLDPARHVAGARNAGIQVARGEIIAFQDDDDIWLVDKLAKQVAALMNGDDRIGLNLCGHICLKPEFPVYVGGPNYFANIQPQSGYTNLALIATPGWLVWRSFLASAGFFDERMRTLEDWELALRLSEHCRFSHIPEPLFLQDRIEGGNLAHDEKLKADAMRIIMERHADKWQTNRRALSRHYYLIGRMESLHHSSTEGRILLWRSVMSWPANVKAWLALAMSLIGRDATVSLTRVVRRLRIFLRPKAKY